MKHLREKTSLGQTSQTRFGISEFTLLKRGPKGSWLRLKLITKQSKPGIIRLSALMLAN